MPTYQFKTTERLLQILDHARTRNQPVVLVKDQGTRRKLHVEVCR